ncbi:MAG: phage portal protein [Clostridium sp.]|nr:phage portal protein [Clostridium sp.]MCM1534634.1 phage portal protein [Clostridium sp.]
MGIFSGLFKSRDHPAQDSLNGGSYRFLFGGSTSGKRVNERSAMQMTAVYSCVRILSEAVAGLPLHLYQYTADGGKEKALSHPLYFLLHDEPNPEMTSFVFRETLMTHLLLWGNAYAQVIRNGKGEVIGLYPLMPDRMTVDRDEKGRLYYEYQVQESDAKTIKSGTVRLLPHDVLHIPGLGFDGLVGYSPIAMAKNAIGLAIATEEYGSKFFANGATPGGLLEYPGTVKNPDAVRESWEKGFSQGNSHKIAVLEEGMKYTPISISPNEAQFLETRKFQINEIARIFRVPPHMVGDLEKSSFSNIEQQSLEFVKYTLEPWLMRWEQAMSRALFSQEEKTEYFVKFNVDGLLRGDYESRMKGYATARQNGWMSANDIRELENLDRIPAELGGDLYLINGNMTKLADAGIFAASGKEEEPDEEVLEMEESDGGQSGDAGNGDGTDAVSERHNRRGKLV